MRCARRSRRGTGAPPHAAAGGKTLALIPALLIAAGSGSPSRADTLTARRLWTSYLERAAALDEQGSFALLKGARDADPAFLPAELDYLAALTERVGIAERRRLITDGVRDRGLARCLAIIAVPVSSRGVVDSLRALEREQGPSDCTRGMLALWLSNVRPVERSLLPPFARWRAMLGTLARDYVAWLAYANAVRTAGDSAESQHVLDEAERVVDDPRQRVGLAVLASHWRGERGDTASARAVLAAADHEMRRDGRPGIRLAYLARIIAWLPRSPRRDSLERETIGIARSQRAAAALAGQYVSVGAPALDAGDVNTAINYFRSAAAIADRLRWQPLRSTVHARLGRALIKQGRAHEGIAQLRLAARLADPDERYGRADIQHNLAHGYETVGDIERALRAIDRFVELATPLSGDGIAIISLRDAGVMRWNAGLHASARAAFERMVRAIDAQRAYYYYAGEYYERIGDLARARHYYGLVPQNDTEEGARALAGRARVLEALGLGDSAAIVARRHDEAPGTAEEIPLWPDVVARRGHPAEAVAAMRAWVERQAPQHNVERTTRGATHLAALLLATGDHAGARRQARAAADLAASVGLTDRRARAILVEARALLAAGDADASVEMLLRADSLLRGRAPAATDFELHLALGDAFASCGRTADALRAYDRAAAASRRMRDSFESDYDRGLLHAARIAPYDAAMRELLGAAKIDYPMLIRWSQRRKEALFAGPTDHPPASLTDIRATLNHRDAIVDYVVLDSLVAAIVITPARTAAVILPIDARTLASRVETFRAPTRAYLGQVDLSRVQFDSRNAYQLYAALVRPLEPLLGDVDRLGIVPDGPLHLLPFDGLVSTATGSGSYLLDRYEISYIASLASAPADGAARPLARDRLLLVEYGVAGGDAEAAAISAAWRAGVSRLDGSHATESQVTRRAPEHGIVHFAVHGGARMDDPLSASLSLAADDHDDGALQPREIERMHLRAGLVVLSACETDVGRILRGVGAMGLARAFLLSGARTVIGTQWAVGPSVPALMSEFYRRLARGETPSRALRGAKLALRARSATSNPFYWAAFTLTRAR